jgi:protein-L-isoaspartate(D-aspartate) O-methyltransferase
VTGDLAARRRFFAEEIQAVAGLKGAALVEALATVPREAFLGPGPWVVQSDMTGARPTPDADPRHVYHNYSVAIDPERQLFNGAPALVAGAIDLLGLTPGVSVLHVGAGLGYYSAVLAHVTGPTGRVVAIEVDKTLAARAQANTAARPWLDIRAGDATSAFDDTFDAILVSTGVTHPQPAWLDALRDGGRMIVPLTAVIPAMGPVGKGVMVAISRRPGGEFAARALTFVAIYSGIGLRDSALNEQLGRALMRSPFPRLTRLRRDAHEAESACWLHGTDFCLSG